MLSTVNWPDGKRVRWEVIVLDGSGEREGGAGVEDGFGDSRDGVPGPGVCMVVSASPSPTSAGSRSTLSTTDVCSFVA